MFDVNSRALYIWNHISQNYQWIQYNKPSEKYVLYTHGKKHGYVYVKEIPARWKGGCWIKLKQREQTKNDKTVKINWIYTLCSCFTTNTFHNFQISAAINEQGPPYSAGAISTVIPLLHLTFHFYFPLFLKPYYYNNTSIILHSSRPVNNKCTLSTERM